MTHRYRINDDVMFEIYFLLNVACINYTPTVITEILYLIRFVSLITYGQKCKMSVSLCIYKCTIKPHTSFLQHRHRAGFSAIIHRILIPMPTEHGFVETKYYQRIKTDHALTFRIFLGGHTTNLDRRHVPPIHRPTAFFCGSKTILDYTVPIWTNVTEPFLQLHSVSFFPYPYPFK